MSTNANFATLERQPVMAPPSRVFTWIFIAILAAGVIYVGQQLTSELEQAPDVGFLPFILLAVALLIALGFEFVNGFHDTANAVATVIYTHAMPAQLAVVWSGFFNFLGVLTSTGLVAFGIVSLLPVELILKVGSGAGFAMVFALLVAAIIWNLGTWLLGLPSSSSHTLIGSIIGVGLMNQLTASAGSGTSGVDWGQALGIAKSLLFSPIVGFIGAALLLILMRAVIRVPGLYRAPSGNRPPPIAIRALLILTCTGVSFAHGSNDGQKGMGLIMLILIGTVPTAFALNRAVDERHVPAFVAHGDAAISVFQQTNPAPIDASVARSILEKAIGAHQIGHDVVPALASVTNDIVQSVQTYGSLAKIPHELVQNVRNDMYLVDEALRMGQKQTPPLFAGTAEAAVNDYRAELGQATRFIPTWVKVAVALALGLGTMVGWKRIVVTVGERIGKSHLTYGQGASAELVAAATIFAADHYGLPVSTTHVLSSGVAGTMAANRSGLQWATVRNLAMAWILTLPASIALSGGLFWLFRTLAPA